MSKRSLTNYLYHTVYLSYEEGLVGRCYVGKHSTDNPYDDYFGSFHDLSFSPVGKHILGVYRTPQGATQGEIMWQRVLNVVEDPRYVNRAYQTSTGFDTTGRKRSVKETSPGGLAMKGMLVWNDGVTQTRAKTCPGPNWVRGYVEDNLESCRANPKGTSWWFNPDTGENKRSLESPGEEWVKMRSQVSTNTQLWQCTVTGHISTPGPLSRWQKSRGIDHTDKSLRRRIT
jgi:hypothetical protein